MTDGELVRLAVAGDAAAYGELVRRWFRRIFAYCQSRVFASDAEDLTQDTFVRGHLSLHTLTNPEQFGPWLRGIAHNICADWGRNTSRLRRALPVTDSVRQFDGVPMIRIEGIADDERAIIIQQLEAMPEDLREVILLRYYEELTYDEMARWLGIARATVNERLSKARALLRIRLATLRSNT